MSLLNDVAPWNIADMSLTLDTSHFEMSRLKDFALWNTRLMSLTLDTSHCPMEQAPFGNTLRHLETACWSSALDRTVYKSPGVCGGGTKTGDGARNMVRLRLRCDCRERLRTDQV